LAAPISPSLRSHGEGLARKSTLSTEVHLESVYAVQQHAATVVSELYAVPANVSSRDASSLSYPLPASQPAFIALSSPPLRSDGDGLERTSTLSTEVPSGSVHAVQQNPDPWSVTNTHGSGIEANPELMVLSSKDKDNALSKTELKPTVVAVLGLTGAGKSTFIRNITRSADVTIGHGYRSGKHL
jgi:predicted alpha/beta-fold hydrolase